jgi:catechol 2,3-dioxygenase-like lactoylglutathione lyase family enzyme
MLSSSPVSATFPVRDLQAEHQFYTDKLGLSVAAGSVDKGFLEYRAGKGTNLMLFKSDTGGQKRGNTNATFEVADLKREMDELRGRGVRFLDYDLPGVKTVNGIAKMGEGVMAWIEDPEGYVLALHQATK